MSEQQAFAEALFDPALPVPALISRTAGREPLRRFNIYRNNVMVSLREALAASFPVTRQMVGDAFFAAMAREFILAHPPRSPVLTGYGAEFPGFVRNFGPAGALPYLADLARLEFLQVEAFHAADAPPLAPAVLAQFPPDDLAGLRLVAHPAARIIRSGFAIASLWFAHHGRSDPDTIELGGIDPLAPEAALVTRPDLTVEIRRIPPAQMHFVSMVLAGETLGDASDKAQSEDAACDLTAGLVLLLESGAIAATLTDREIDHGAI